MYIHIYTYIYTQKKWFTSNMNILLEQKGGSTCTQQLRWLNSNDTCDFITSRRLDLTNRCVHQPNALPNQDGSPDEKNTWMTISCCLSELTCMTTQIQNMIVGYSRSVMVWRCLNQPYTWPKKIDHTTKPLSTEVPPYWLWPQAKNIGNSIVHIPPRNPAVD